jgi:hypothetical protein
VRHAVGNPPGGVACLVSGTLEGVWRFKLEPGERTLQANDAQWMKSWWSRPLGRLYFTTQRLVFEPVIQRSGHPAITAMQEMRDFPINVGRDGLNSVSVIEHKKCLVLAVKTDHEVFKFAGLPNDEWRATMHDAIESDRSALAELVQRLERNAAPGPDGDPYRGGAKPKA